MARVVVVVLQDVLRRTGGVRSSVVQEIVAHTIKVLLVLRDR